MIRYSWGHYNMEQRSRQTIDTARTEYRSYLLRLWRLSETSPWHVMLEEVGSQERHTFGNLENLLDFLREGEGAPVIENASLLNALERNS